MLSQQNQVIPCENTRLNDFNALAFEQQRYEIFQQTESQSVLSESYLDGNWDAVIGCEPTENRWLDSEYRQGYLEGIAKKYDEKYGLI